MKLINAVAKISGIQIVNCFLRMARKIITSYKKKKKQRPVSFKTFLLLFYLI